MTQTDLMQRLKPCQDIEQGAFGITAKCMIRLKVIFQASSGERHHEPRWVVRQIGVQDTNDVWMINLLLIPHFSLEALHQHSMILLLECGGVELLEGVGVTVVASDAVYDVDFH